jgi:hypothetical protein
LAVEEQLQKGEDLRVCSGAIKTELVHCESSVAVAVVQGLSAVGSKYQRAIKDGRQRGFIVWM